MIPVVLYEVQSKFLTGQDKKMIEIRQPIMERNFSGMTTKGKVRNTEGRRMTSMREATAWTSMLKYGSREPVTRTDRSKLNYIATI